MTATTPPQGTGLILQETLGGRFLNGLEALSKRLINKKLPQGIWDAASAIFTGNAKGDVHIFLRNSRANSVYKRIEEPILDIFKNAVKRLM